MGKAATEISSAPEQACRLGVVGRGIGRWVPPGHSHSPGHPPHLPTLSLSPTHVPHREASPSPPPVSPSTSLPRSSVLTPSRSPAVSQLPSFYLCVCVCVRTSQQIENHTHRREGGREKTIKRGGGLFALLSEPATHALRWREVDVRGRVHRPSSLHYQHLSFPSLKQQRPANVPRNTHHPAGYREQGSA